MPKVALRVATAKLLTFHAQVKLLVGDADTPRIEFPIRYPFAFVECVSATDFSSTQELHSYPKKSICRRIKNHISTYRSLGYHFPREFSKRYDLLLNFCRYLWHCSMVPALFSKVSTYFIPNGNAQHMTSEVYQCDAIRPRSCLDKAPEQ